MPEIRGLYSIISLKDRLSAPLRKANASLDQAKAKMGRVGLAVNTLKTKMSGAVGVIKQHQMAFAALGAAFTAIGYGGMRILLGSAKELESVFGYLEAQTGALGDELSTLKETVVALARVNSDAFGVIGDTIAITRKRFGELGDETTSVNQIFLDFAKIAKTDAVASTEALTKIMKAYDIPAQDAVRVTDLLLGAQAKYNINSAKVNRALGEQSAALRIWGMSLEESIGLLSAMDTAGIDTSRALTSLKTAASEFETPEQFWEYMEELAMIESSAKRAAAAEEVFGASAGPAMALMLDDGVDAMRNYILTEDEVAGATKKASTIIDETLSEQLGILKNNLKLVSAEMGKTLVPMLKMVGDMVLHLSDFFMGLPKGIKFVIAAVAGLVTALALVAGPALLMMAALTMAAPSILAILPASLSAAYGLGGLSLMLKTAALSVKTFTLALMTNPIFLALLGIVAAILILQHAWTKNWGDIQGKTKKVIDFFKGAFGWVMEKLNAIKKFLPLLFGPIGAIYMAFKNWDKIKGVLSKTGSAIKTKLGDAVDEAKGKIEGLTNAFAKTKTGGMIIDIATKVKTGDIKGILKDMVKLPYAHIDDITKGFENITNRIGEVFGAENLGTKITEGIKGIKDKIKENIEGLTSIFRETKTGEIAIDIATKVREGDIAGVLKTMVMLPRAYLGDIAASFEAITNRIGELFGIENLGTEIIEGIRGTMNRIKDSFGDLKDMFFDAGGNLIKAFVEGIKAFANAPVDAIKEIGKRIREFLPFSDSRLGALRDLTASGGKLVSTFTEGMLQLKPELTLKMEELFKGVPVIGEGISKLMPAPAEMISSTSTSITNASHSEDKRVSISKIELHIDGVSNNAEEIGDTVIRRIKREFERYGI